MSHITVGRYEHESISQDWSGYVETDDWIMYLDPAGRPALLWLERDPEGGVIGEPITLTP